jgi:hypothetical protein
MLGVSILLAIIMHFKKLGFWVLISAAAMSAIWEVILFIFGLRDYNNPLAQLIGPIPEIVFHSFAEMPALLLIGLLVIHKLGIIDLAKFRDDNWHKLEERGV